MIAGVISGDLVAPPPPSLFLSLSLSKSPRGGCVLPFVSISSNGNVFGRLPCDTSRLLVYRGAAQSMRELQREQAECRICREHAWVSLTLSLRNHPGFIIFMTFHVPRLHISLYSSLFLSPPPLSASFPLFSLFLALEQEASMKSIQRLTRTSSLIVSCLIMARLIARNVLNNTK